MKPAIDKILYGNRKRLKAFSPLFLILPFALNACLSSYVKVASTPSKSAAVFTLSSSHSGLMINDTEIITVTNGTSPYTYSAVLGTFALNVYTAPASVTGASQNDIITVTDSAGLVVRKTFTIYPAISISMTNTDIAVGDSATYTITGGVPPFNITTNNGSIVAGTSTYTASATTGATIVSVTDALSHAASTGSFTVKSALTISAASPLAPLGTESYTVSGGTAPYVVDEISNVGTVSNGTGSGNYTAPASGSITLRVTDSRGGGAAARSATKNITLSAALAISVTDSTLAVSTTTAYTLSGGSGTYTTVVPTRGARSSGTASGTYTAPATVGGGTDRLTVTDSNGATAYVDIAINAALQASMTLTEIEISTDTTYTVSGGVPPYTATTDAAGNHGTVLPVTQPFTPPAGVLSYTASATSGSDHLIITDAYGSSISIAITVDPHLVLTMDAGNTVQQGTGPFTFTVTGGTGGTVVSSCDQGTASMSDATHGSYTPPVGWAGTDYIHITDSQGVYSPSLPAITVTSGQTLSIASNRGSTVLPSQASTLTVSGGTPPYSISTFSNNSIGSSAVITDATAGTATYTSGTYNDPNPDIICFTDSFSGTPGSTCTNIYIDEPSFLTGSGSIAPVALDPNHYDIPQGCTIPLTITGGTGPFTSASGFYSSTGARTGQYTSPMSNGAEYVNVEDSLGLFSSQILFNIWGPPLAVTPGTGTLLPAGSFANFSVTDGTVAYSISYTGGSLNGISVSNSTSGYLASFTGNVGESVTLTVSDGCATNIQTASFFNAIFSPNIGSQGSSAVINVGDTITVGADGGSGSFNVTTSTGGSSGPTGSYGFFTAMSYTGTSDGMETILLCDQITGACTSGDITVQN